MHLTQASLVVIQQIGKSMLHVKVVLTNILFFCLFLVLQGCAGVTGLTEKPKVSIADIQVQEMKNMETSFLVQLRVTNPNAAELDIQGVSCNLEIDGRHFAHGITNSAQQIPAYGTALVPVNVYASMVDVVSSVVGFIGSSKADADHTPLAYTLDGTIRLGTGGFTSNLPFTNSGELSFDSLTSHN